jgi:hypothetical protein
MLVGGSSLSAHIHSSTFNKIPIEYFIHSLILILSSTKYVCFFQKKNFISFASTNKTNDNSIIIIIQHHDFKDEFKFYLICVPFSSLLLEIDLYFMSHGNFIFFRLPKIYGAFGKKFEFSTLLPKHHVFDIKSNVVWKTCREPQNCTIPMLRHESREAQNTAKFLTLTHFHIKNNRSKA